MTAGALWGADGLEVSLGSEPCGLGLSLSGLGLSLKWRGATLGRVQRFELEADVRGAARNGNLPQAVGYLVIQAIHAGDPYAGREREERALALEEQRARVAEIQAAYPWILVKLQNHDEPIWPMSEKERHETIMAALRALPAPSVTEEAR